MIYVINNHCLMFLMPHDHKSLLLLWKVSASMNNNFNNHCSILHMLQDYKSSIIGFLLLTLLEGVCLNHVLTSN